MKLMMVLTPSDCLKQVQQVIESHEIHVYTEIPNVLGAGRSGRKLGTRAFPGTSSLLMTILDTQEADELVRAIRECAEAAGCKDGFRVFAVPAEEMF